MPKLTRRRLLCAAAPLAAAPLGVKLALDAGGLGAVGTAEHRPVGLHPVPHHPAAAVAAHRCEGMDRALEAVEDVRAAQVRDLERLVVVVPADVADHRVVPFRPTVLVGDRPGRTGSKHGQPNRRDLAISNNLD